MGKQEFKLPYAGIEEIGGLSVLYGESGDFSVILSIENPVLIYSADPAGYQAFHLLLLNVIKILSEGYIIQKQDVFSKRTYQAKVQSEPLQQKYDEHFSGREYIEHSSYLVITRQVKRRAMYVYDRKALLDFVSNIAKVCELLKGASVSPKVLPQGEIERYISRMLAMDFSSDHFSLNNLRAGDTEIGIGKKVIRCMSLVNIDSIDMPESIGPYLMANDGKGLQEFPMDNLSFLSSVPGIESLVYNQLIEIPSQGITLNKLQLKRKRHSGVPDPANQMCVEDIDKLLIDVARENQLLVNAHYSLLVCCELPLLDTSCNFIEASLFQQGIIPSKNAYNQMELFRSALPGNAVELKKYDWFLTTSDAALCLFYKERLMRDEPSKFLMRFTDRRGIPVGIDPADLPMESGRITNRSKFVLGSSGTGKSFFMNSLLEQYMLYNYDIVIVDVGHSYSGLCNYFGGKYYTYTEENPITMNPFLISEAEYNIEKKDFLKTLIGLLLKGAEGSVSQIEDTVFSNVLSAYYSDFFLGEADYALCFDSFYHYSIVKISEIKENEKISFDLDEYRYVLKKFCLGGEYGRLLNESADLSDFTERFIVYEIDSIKENRVLFPIVTLVIMDLVLQKMRHRTGQRKAMILEEAWKAIASPLMANYILYLYKTMRKFWGEPIVVTQELGDIIGNAVIKDSILASSDTICLLDQSKFRGNYAEVAKLLALSEVEQRKIFTINALENKAGRGKFKEVYIKRGSIGEVYGVEVSLFQYLTFTTEKPEKTAVESYVKRYGSYPLGLEHFVADMKMSAISLPEFVKKVNSSITS
ncbi:MULTISPECIES: TraG family conjugative transposon ATPase [Pedobacter]|uniref:TraG family conjugative transposon ATPase n=2 Tax=Pedobacter TaxID=84567 RepID=A0A369PPX5_9SPHI|nr:MULTISPECIES: TraG family conjugative transposon ATPase [Pedobacter]KQR68245.1 conjugal transfer protein TraG [Pedobacter sp. Leaf176]MCZ4224685.1 TraG family conjugative transposon ATPase [Pedobacter sp. SJ11]RDC54583.1 TraG family conjugative transposon ATPase [Pedobacter chinensis]RZM28845.1 MAG: TraG family conjugative transposon ATPase [Pedobacter sp.]